MALLDRCVMEEGFEVSKTSTILLAASYHIPCHHSHIGSYPLKLRALS